MEQQRCLVDTNVLLCFDSPDSANYSACVAAFQTLQRTGTLLYYSLQNAAEFWNVSTRPSDRNGQGLTPKQAEQGLNLIEQKMTLLADTERLYSEWKRLVVTHHVKGLQVRDARLAAVMIVHEISQILTFNGRDFARFPELKVIHPASLADH